jgi:hypothetical protein
MKIISFYYPIIKVMINLHHLRDIFKVLPNFKRALSCTFNNDKHNLVPSRL